MTHRPPFRNRGVVLKIMVTLSYGVVNNTITLLFLPCFEHMSVGSAIPRGTSRNPSTRGRESRDHPFCRRERPRPGALALVLRTHVHRYRRISRVITWEGYFNFAYDPLLRLVPLAAPFYMGRDYPRMVLIVAQSLWLWVARIFVSSADLAKRRFYRAHRSVAIFNL